MRELTATAGSSRCCSAFTRLMALAAVLVASTAMAQYPDRPIRGIVPFAPGGANDVMARVISPQITKLLGQPVIIDNRPGALGHIGIEATAKSKPDGYTILFSATASTVLPAMSKAMRYDPIKDIQPVAEIGQGPYVVVVNPKVPATSLRELIEYARKNPGKLNGGAGGAAGTRLAIELMKIQNNIQLEIIMYNGNGPTATALLKGEVDFATMDTSAFVGYLASGRIKAFAVAGEKRLPSLPDVPTTAEAGFPDFRAGAIFGVYVAAGTPAPIVQKLNETINAIIVIPEIVEQLRKLGSEPNPKSVEVFTQLIRREIQTWKDVVAKAKIPLDDP